MKLSAVKRLDIYKQFYELSREGVSIKDTLECMLSIAERVKAKSKISLYKGWLSSYSDMPSIAAVLKKDIPENEYLLISASEKSGNISEGFFESIELINSNQKIKDLLISSLVPPGVLLILCIVIVIGYARQVLIVFVDFAAVSTWPPISANLYNAGYYFSDYSFLYLIFGVSITVYGFFYFSKNGSNKLRDIFHNIGIYSLLEQFITVTFLKMLGTLMTSGVSYNDALTEIHSSTTQGWLKSKLEKVMLFSRDNNSIVESLDVFFIPQELLALLGVYSNSNNFATSILIVANNQRLKLEKNVAVLGKILNTVGILLVSITAIWIYYAMFGLSSMLSSGMSQY
ncbi:hypothetical protein GCM10007916_28820 [Psychromonas marina]|uniref:Type II secretion system protein GspF domain-containing protein n=1 Tax=Psychromonas marina TaxID=88364 RepID=A0ABQ6E396_9GAMM|nr:type II secretion system F family protein [Psychromonas marina]GLS91812.1 hypothetical protein GCM10007916_28820 [Psychromonas marina]